MRRCCRSGRPLCSNRAGSGEAEADATELREAVTKAGHDRAAAVAIADEAVREAEELRQAQDIRAGALGAAQGGVAG